MDGPSDAEAPIEWHAAAGAQIDADSHGDVNLGLRSGAWTFALRTDAPEITWAPKGERGRAWVTARGHAFAAAMYISPWTDGAPDPGRALRASSVGAEAGWVGYGPAGVYAGGRAALDGVFFGAQSGTVVAIVDRPGRNEVGGPVCDGARARAGRPRGSASACGRGAGGCSPT